MRTEIALCSPCAGKTFPTCSAIDEPEDDGRIDMTVLFENRAYIFEFKVTDLDQTPGSALDRINGKGYADKCRAESGAVYPIGVEFQRGQRNIVGFAWERVG